MKTGIFYILILCMLVGFFSPREARAAGACFSPDGQRINLVNLQTKGDCLKANNASRQKNYDECASAVPFESSAGKFPNVQACAKYFSVAYWVEGVAPTPVNPNPGTIPPAPAPKVTPAITQEKPYVLLAPLLCEKGTAGCVEVDGKYVLKTFDAGVDKPLGSYLNILLKIFIGLCAVLAMAMIVVGGLEYMTSELVSSKESGKHKITGAVFGLVLALGSYALLNTINPDLLKSDVEIKGVELVDLGGESPDPFAALNPSALSRVGINCPQSGLKPALETIGRQFIGKTAYSMEAGKRNTITSSGIVTLDCSAFVAQVYECAGLPSPGGNTAGMFGSGATAVTGATFDEKQLHTGDLVGWVANPPKEKFGHVAIYLGNGYVLDTQPSGTAVRPLGSIKNRVTFVKWPN